MTVSEDGGIVPILQKSGKSGSREPGKTDGGVRHGFVTTASALPVILPRIPVEK